MMKTFAANRPNIDWNGKLVFNKWLGLKLNQAKSSLFTYPFQLNFKVLTKIKIIHNLNLLYNQPKQLQFSIPLQHPNTVIATQGRTP